MDSNGDPLNGGKLYTYTAGSSTPQTTYTTSAGNVQNANPIVLGSTGYPTSGGSVVAIWLTAGVSYKFILENAAGTVLWTRDNISGINDTTVTIDQWVSGPAPTYISATSFTLAGDQTTTFHVGRRVKTTNSGGTIYSTITASAYGALTTVTVANDSGTLDSGLSAVAYGLISSLNTGMPVGVSGIPIVCSGRLTLASATPVMTSDQAGKTTIYFTPYNGAVIPVYNGTNHVPTPFLELSQATTDSTKSPAAVANNSNYDLFVWNDAGTLRCTRGPAWTSDTARGTGAGTTELEMVKGLLLNKVAITNGPAANRGTYVGTVRSNGSAQIDWKLGTAASGGGPAWLGVWNMYNRVDVVAQSEDTVASYTYQTATARSMNASTNNRVSFVLGVAEDAIHAERSQFIENSASGDIPGIGISLDSTSSFTESAVWTNIQASGQGVPVARFHRLGLLGFHYLQAVEIVAGTAAACTFYGPANDARALFNFKARM